MHRSWSFRFAALAFLALGVALTQTTAPAPAAGRWYKGNLHTHTLNSDGDSAPSDVAVWYREHGYNFLLLSDHNHLTESAPLNAAHQDPGKFILLQGEEVTDAWQDKPIHVNAYDLATELQPRHGTTVANTIQNNVDAILAAKALPSINHPNYGWAVTADDLLRVQNLGLMEVYNGHPTVNNVGGGGFQSLDEMWDVLLSAGRRIKGIAVDDAHHFKRFGREFANPGRGWIEVRAEELTPAALRQAIEQGQFYASTGVKLADVQITPATYTLVIAPQGTEKFTTSFIGSKGRVLARSFDTTPSYRFKGGEGYVRARVQSSYGSAAWTQPAFR
ncbi:MAG: CehA/McbA family metallohydrolase [Candidatus Solibacter sp.]